MFQNLLHFQQSSLQTPHNILSHNHPPYNGMGNGLQKATFSVNRSLPHPDTDHQVKKVFPDKNQRLLHKHLYAQDLLFLKLQRLLYKESVHSLKKAIHVHRTLSPHVLTYLQQSLCLTYLPDSKLASFPSLQTTHQIHHFRHRYENVLPFPEQYRGH